MQWMLWARRQFCPHFASRGHFVEDDHRFTHVLHQHTLVSSTGLLGAGNLSVLGVQKGMRLHFANASHCACTVMLQFLAMANRLCEDELRLVCASGVLCRGGVL